MDISSLKVGKHVLVKCSGKKTEAYYVAQIILKVGKHVLVKCSGKKTEAYYVAQIIENNYVPDGSLGVKYFKRIFESNIVNDSDEMYEIDKDDITMILPKPKQMKGSARVAGYFVFNINFYNSNVE
ncbi:hypothetical protein QE152_g7806 [Popillia japonica]|uniref:Ribosomal protein L14 n=1 Tax=Popillia japonica TaxID=7064 RepID=A0AAW1MF32_POPJA